MKSKKTSTRRSRQHNLKAAKAIGKVRPLAVSTVSTASVLTGQLPHTTNTQQYIEIDSFSMGASNPANHTPTPAPAPNNILSTNIIVVKP